MNIPRLETKETKHLKENYPDITYLETEYVGDWLLERKDQLLEVAKEERQGSSVSKVLGLAVGSAGFILHATSPLAPIGALLGLGAYFWSIVKDVEHTHELAPIPFIRGGVLEMFGSLGNADLRGEYLSGIDDFEQLQHYLSPVERREYKMLTEFFTEITNYLEQVDPFKRFHAYRWILDCYCRFKGKLPAKEALDLHLLSVRENALGVNPQLAEAIADTQLRVTSKVKDAPRKVLAFHIAPELPEALNDDEVYLEPQEFGEINLPPKRERKKLEPDFNELRKLPLKQRAVKVIELLEQSGFNLADAIQGQTTVIAGNQRGGKGTLLAILAILSKAMNPSLVKINYFTAGEDIYPFICDKLVYAGSFPYAEEPDAKVAQALLKHIREMSKSPVGSLADEILVIDEAIALSGFLEDEDKLFLAKFLLTRAEKTGCQTFIVLHAQNLTAWIGGKNTEGLAATFKTGVSFIGCEAKKVKTSALRVQSVATGKYFLADPNSFASPLPDGQLGTLPDWLKKEINPNTGAPDPARTMLSIFPELVSMDLGEDPQDSDEAEETVLEETPRDMVVSYFSNAKKNEPKSFRDLRMANKLREISKNELSSILLDLQKEELLDINEDGLYLWCGKS